MGNHVLNYLMSITGKNAGAEFLMVSWNVCEVKTRKHK